MRKLPGNRARNEESPAGDIARELFKLINEEYLEILSPLDSPFLW